MCQQSVAKPYIALLIMCTFVVTSRSTADENDDWHFYGENIAFHKSTNQLPATYFDQYISPSQPEKYYQASLAVDGDTNGNFKHGSCSHTLGKASVDASWTVDLGKPFNITGIVIYNRDDVKVRLKNFQIYGDDHTLIYNSSGTDLHKETILTFKLDGLHSFSTITILLPKHHGYSDGGDYFLTLCEVQIYAAPRPACDVTQTNLTNGQAQIYNYTGRLINHQYTVGTIIEVYCEEKFHPDGASRFECLATGEYDYPIPKCVESLCTVPNVTNGKFINVLSTKFEVGTTLQFTCDPGFTAAASKDTIICEKHFQWNNKPVCQVESESDTRSVNPVVTACVVISVVVISVLVIFIYRRRRKCHFKKLPYTCSWTGIKNMILGNQDRGEVPGRAIYTQTCVDDDMCIDITVT